MTQIYVGNIPYGKDENDLKDLFGQYGEVSSVKFVNDKETGRFRGFGFLKEFWQEFGMPGVAVEHTDQA